MKEKSLKVEKRFHGRIRRKFISWSKEKNREKERKRKKGKKKKERKKYVKIESKENVSS